MKYFRALRLMYPEDKLSISLGKYSITQKPVHKVVEATKLRASPTINAWHIEEKQTDVNLALSMYHDAVNERVDNIVMCGNDSDISPALKLIKENANTINIGLIVPVRKNNQLGLEKRQPNKELRQYANWIRHSIDDDSLKKAQLPDFIPAKRKGVKKPTTW